MKKMLLIALGALCITGSAMARPAPDFTLNNAEGKEVALSQFAGKTIVLEWSNTGCPFVQKWYKTGEMDKVRDQLKGDDLVWLVINSSAKGQQGHVSADDAVAVKKEFYSKASDYLLDPDGKVGMAYGAQATPHLFVINDTGSIVYSGAIDSIPSYKVEDIARSENYVVSAVTSLRTGKPIAVSSTRAYGCAMKYPR